MKFVVIKKIRSCLQVNKQIYMKEPDLPRVCNSNSILRFMFIKLHMHILQCNHIWSTDIALPGNIRTALPPGCADLYHILFINVLAIFVNYCQ